MLCLHVKRVIMHAVIVLCMCCSVAFLSIGTIHVLPVCFVHGCLFTDMHYGWSASMSARHG